MSYTNYTIGVPTGNQGDPDSTYNLLIAGGSDYGKHSGLLLKNDSTLQDGQSHKGTHIYQDSQDNAYFDLRTISGGQKNIAFRLQDDNNPEATTSMLLLTDDDGSSNSTYGAIVNGRIKASQYYVGQADNRVPDQQGVYMGFDSQTKGYFRVNKGTGSGGFQFQTHNEDGSIAQINLNLDASGTIEAPYYSASTDPQDSESIAIAGFDATGKLVRSYKQNQRFRSLESRMATVEGETVQGIPQKLNELIERFNNLNFYSNDIQPLVFQAPAPPFVVTAPKSSTTTE